MMKHHTMKMHQTMVIQNGNSKKRILTGKDGVVRMLPPVSDAEIHAVEKERKARTILLMAICHLTFPREHLRRFMEWNGNKKIWEAIRLEGLEKGYDRFQQLLSQLEAHGAEVSTEDANHKSLRSLPPACTCTPTSSNNFQEREVLVGFADEVIYSLFAKQSKDLDLLHEDLEQIDDVDIEEMDINWQIAMIAIRMKKFVTKRFGRRVRIDGNKPVGLGKKKLECFKCHNTVHFARECPSKETNDGKKRDSFYQDQGTGKKEQNQTYADD
ncbi:ribonuclease H-like domain-containing protein [Tanacetum coccineum]